MKKQIFILVFLVVATFASVTKSYGQAVHGNTAPTAISCSTTDPLNPIPGIPYDYSAILSPAGGEAKWHVVFNPTTLMTGSAWTATDESIGATFLAAATGLTNLTAASPSITNITWKSEGLATVDATHPLIVALEYKGPAAGCANNNLQVFQITPKNAFTLDITAMDNTGATSKTIGDNTYAQCFSNIKGAVFSGGKVQMDYGDNTMYFEVIAANFTTSFTPTFKLSGLQTGQTADVSWGYTVAGATTSIVAGTTNATLTPITALTSATNTSAGVSIYVKVVVHNLTWEGTTDEPISLAVEGVNAASQADVTPTCAAPATTYEDLATQILSARPTVTTSIAGGFVTKN